MLLGRKKTVKRASVYCTKYAKMCILGQVFICFCCRYIKNRKFINSFDGGETMLHLAQRIYNLLDEVKKDEEKTYLLVAHNGIARVIRSYFEDMTNEEYAAYGIRNCEILSFEF